MSLWSSIGEYLSDFDSFTMWSVYRLNFLSPDTFMASNEYSNRFSDQFIPNAPYIFFNLPSNPLKRIIELSAKRSIQKHGLDKVISIAKSTLGWGAKKIAGAMTEGVFISFIVKNIIYDFMQTTFFKKLFKNGIGEKALTATTVISGQAISGFYNFEIMQIHSMKSYVWLGQNDKSLGKQLYSKNLDTLFFMVFKQLAPIIEGKVR